MPELRFTHLARSQRSARESANAGVRAAPVSVAERERKFLTVGTVVVKPEEVKTAEVAEASQEGHKEATPEQGV